MRRIFTILFVVQVLTTYSQTHAPTKLTQGKLQAVHKHLQDRFTTDKIAGASVLVAQNGNIVFDETVGYFDKEPKRLLTKNDVFRLASMSKPLTGAAILLLVDEGKIKLDDAVYNYLPEFKNLKVAVPDNKADVKEYKPDPNAPLGTISPVSNYHIEPANRPVTIRDLLTHSSGIAQGAVGFAESTKMPFKPGMTLAAYIWMLPNLPLDFQPGTQTGYSPLAGIDICGRIIEVVSGQRLDKFMAECLFKPLEMKNTGYIQNAATWRKVVTQYTVTDSGVIRAAEQYPFFIDSVYFSGSGGIISTIEDYYHFVQMLADGGTYKGKRILSRNMVNQMSSAQLADSIKGLSKGQNWGLSVRVITADATPDQPLGKKCFGWSGAYGTHFWIDPVNHIVALYFNNLSNGGGAGADTARELEKDVVDALKE